MSKYDSLNPRQFATKVPAELLEALQELFGDDLDISRGKVKYTDEGFKMEIAVYPANDGPKMTPATEAFHQFADVWGFDRSWLGETFLVDGQQFRLVGFKPSNRKYPVLAERTAGGGTYKFTRAIVRRAFGSEW